MTSGENESLTESTSIEDLLQNKPLEEVMAEETVNYRAKSVLKSATIWTGVVGTIAGGVSTIDPTVFGEKATPWLTVIVSLASLFLRFKSKRPVAFIGFNESKPVSVPKL